MTAERYVATEALRQAMCGREADVLRALGVEWNKGAHHISCPYPDHADQNPSWRWDGRKARAFCTCITQRGGHAILEIVKRMEGIEFDAAKLRVAEILGRSDLIETRGQRMDVVSLLQPLPAQRDDAVGSRYLGYRLGVPPDAAPMPTTRVAGWRDLSYYDPPAGKQSKPRLIGRYPCVVFATVASDGRQHAHRIYVAQDGQGKAELGTDARGGRRDPKKSARLEEGESAAGCAVLWGDPAMAPHLLVAEGIETATALALAHQGEIEAGGLAIAAALSTSGLRTFAPWPATRTITIAADRDEGCEADDRGYRAGERAARAFALAHQERLAIRIALPGQEGEDVDWLDVLRRDDIQVVRAGLDDARPFIPTPQEIDDARERAQGASALAEIERTYPPPVMESMTLSYRHTRSGRIMVHKYAGKDKQGEDVWLPVATPFGVPARVRHADQANAYGLRVTVQAMDGRPRAVEFDRATLPRMAAAEIRAQLFAAGLRTEADGEAVAVQALSRRRSQALVSSSPDGVRHERAVPRIGRATVANLDFTDQGDTRLHDPTGRLYRLRRDGRLDTLLDTVPSPNGLVLTPDEDILHPARAPTSSGACCCAMRVRSAALACSCSSRAGPTGSPWTATASRDRPHRSRRGLAGRPPGRASRADPIAGWPRDHQSRLPSDTDVRRFREPH